MSNEKDSLIEAVKRMQEVLKSAKDLKEKPDASKEPKVKGEME